MLEIKKSDSIQSSVYITGLNVKIPTDGSWAPLTGYTKEQIASLDCLRQAYEKELIEIRADDYSGMPSWFYEAYRSQVKVPTYVLEYEEEKVVDYLSNLKEKANIIVWYLVRTELLKLERKGLAREKVLSILMEE